MKVCDEFGLLLLEESFLQEVGLRLNEHPFFNSDDMQRLGKGVRLEEIDKKIEDERAMPLYVEKDRLVGCAQGAHEDDAPLLPT